MSLQIEIVLRVPNIKNRARDEHGYPIDNSTVRFITHTTVDKVPKVGESVRLSTQGNYEFDGSVTRVLWHDESDMFKVYCQFGQPRITESLYHAILADKDWERIPLG